MSPPSAPLLLLLLSLSISLRPLAVAGAALQDACAKTAYPDLCVSSLSAKPESQAASARGLAELAVRVAAEVGTAAGTFARDKLTSSANDTALWQCLDDCADSVEEAIEHLDDSTGVLDDAKFKEVKDWLEAAVADSSTCEDSCKDVPSGEVRDAIVAKNAEFEKLLKVTLTLVTAASAAEAPGAAPAAAAVARPPTP